MQEKRAVSGNVRAVFDLTPPPVPAVQHSAQKLYPHRYLAECAMRWLDRHSNPRPPGVKDVYTSKQRKENGIPSHTTHATADD